MTLLIKFVIGAVIATVVGLLAFQFIDPNVNVKASTSIINEKNSITVEISGEITRAGTYIVENNSVLSDLIEASGGTTSNADSLCYYTELELENGNSYYIAPMFDNDDVCSQAKIIKYNINTCTAEDLQKITGIGSAISTSLISYRDDVGTFKRLEDVMSANGIGQSTFSKLKNFIRLKDE